MSPIGPNEFIVVAPFVVLAWANWFAREIVRGKLPGRAWLILIGLLLAFAWFCG